MSAGTHRTRVRSMGVVAVGVALLLAAVVAGGAGPASAQAGASGDTGAATHPGRMMLVLDSSGSMKEPAAGGSTKIAAAKKALDQVVAGLPTDAQVGMRVYGATVFSKGDAGACTDSQLVVKPGTTNRAELRRAIGKYQPYGETPTGYALEQAAKDLGSEGQRSIVLVSDGEATCKPDPCEVAARLARQGINLHIDVVGLGVSGKARKQLQCVAAKGNGTYYGVDSADEIVNSLSHVARRDVRPFTLEGTPIEGSLDADDPTPITQGVWTDTVPAEQADKNALHYVYTRTMPKSTLHVSAVTLGQPDSSDSIAVRLRTASGDACGGGNDLRQLVRFGALGAQAISQQGPRYGTWGPCATAKRILIDVKRDMALSHQAAPVQVLVAEEPPVKNRDGLPDGFDGDVPAASAGSGKPQPVVGGSSFPDATLLEPGTYSSSAVPGEATMFRVHLDWGQRLAVRFDFPKASPALAEFVGLQGPFADTQIYDPLRAPISDLASDSQNTDFASSDAGTGHVDAETYPVRYHNRSTAGTYSALAGDYYVGLNIARDLDQDTYELPYTLHVAVVGQPNGAPAYEGQPGWSVEQALADNAASATSSTTPAASPSPRAEAGDPPGSVARAEAGDGDGHTGRYVAVGILVAAALAAAGGGLALLRRRTG